MKPMDAVLMICIGVAIGGVAVYFATPKPAAPKERAQVSIGEVTDLIDRLKPLVEYPDQDWRGVSVTITGASARIELRTKDGNEYVGKGKTLQAAATMLDSAKIREALSGWSAERRFPPRTLRITVSQNERRLLLATAKTIKGQP